MSRKPNVLFVMADQHNASCMGASGHPDVQTPNLDKLAKEGVIFNQAFCNNPVCSPSRLCYMSGQYCHTHQFMGNENFEFDHENPDSVGALFRRNGWQTALIGKAHMLKKWDDEAFEYIRYCDLCDAERRDPRTCHYFNYLVENGLADKYEDGALPADHPYTKLGYATMKLPYKHTLEAWTGEETLRFLQGRDAERPFFVHMSFERPHPNFMIAEEWKDLYDPDQLSLAPSSADRFENRFAGKPAFVRKEFERRADGLDSGENLRKRMAAYFTLITNIDMEIGRVISHLKETGEYDNTIIVYTADHGDFAGDHGVMYKNLGIYESIHRVPFIFRYPGGQRGLSVEGIIESVDVYPTLIDCAGLVAPEAYQVDGRSILPVLKGDEPGKDYAICEWSRPAPETHTKINAIRTKEYALIVYGAESGGELYDRVKDPGEITNQWDNPDYADIRFGLFQKLYDAVSLYATRSCSAKGRKLAQRTSAMPTGLIHKGARKWSEVAGLCFDDVRGGLT